MSTRPLQLPQFNLGARVSWTENGVEHEGLFVGADLYFPDYARVDPFDSSLLRNGEKSVMVHSSQLRPPSPARPQARVLEFKTPEPKPQPKTEQPDPAQPEQPEQPKPEQPKPEPAPKVEVEPPKKSAAPSPSDLRLEVALRMANLGIPLIRLHARGKLPIDNGWQNIATTDSDKIRGWFKEDPDTNYACVAKPELFLFLETDQAGVIERYEAETGNKMPATFTVQSSPGKFHRYFRQTDKSRACGQIKQGPGGISFGSLRQNNAYVVGPLSIHPDTGLPYTVVDDSPIVPIPDTLVDWLDAQRASKPAANIEKGEASMPAEDSGLRIEIDPDLEILSGTRDNTLASIAGGLRFHSDNRISYSELEAALSSVNEHCLPPINDPERIAKSYSRKDYASIREKHGVVIGGKFLDSREGMVVVGLRITKDAKVEEIREIDPTAQAAAPPATPLTLEEQVAKDQECTVQEARQQIEHARETKTQKPVVPELDTRTAGARPVFPLWAIKGTSLYEHFVKPAMEACGNSKHEEFLFVPAMQLEMNYLSGKIEIPMQKTHLNLFVGMISPYGKFFKSTSAELAQKYFAVMGLCQNIDPKRPVPVDGKVAVAKSGSSEGFGILMTKAGALNAILYNDELQWLIAKMGIKDSSFGADLLSWWGGAYFGNNVSDPKRAFSFPARTYTFGWLFCTTDRSFNRLWPKIAGDQSGLPDRIFWVVGPESPKPAKMYHEPDMTEDAEVTRGLIEKAILQKQFRFEIGSDFERITDGMNPRSMEMVKTVALYFAVDLELTSITADCIRRARALVDYSDQGALFLEPIEADCTEGIIQKSILRELRRFAGKMPYRKLCRNLDYGRYGMKQWNQAVDGIENEELVTFWKEAITPGKRPAKMIGMVKWDDEEEDS